MVQKTKKLMYEWVNEGEHDNAKWKCKGRCSMEEGGERRMLLANTDAQNFIDRGNLHTAY